MKAYETILRMTDDSVPATLRAMESDPASRDFRGIITQDKGFAEPGSSGSAADTLLSAYFCPDSRWYKDATLLDAAHASLAFLVSCCHADGSIDLRETNFHDCTSNGFSVQTVAYTYRLLERKATTPEELEVKGIARAFLEHSARAMLTGGFHTPNHRWVVASALALCYRCLGEEKCLRMAEIYLSEGIDCNEEGDYTERSVGIYDGVSNESLAIIAAELDKPELYAPIHRNLEKNWYYTEPDFTGLTLASRRQDYGKEAPLARHYYSYYTAATRTGDGRFAWVAARLLSWIEKWHSGPQNLLTRFLLRPEHVLPEERPMPSSYDRLFQGAGVARHRQGDWTCSLLRENSTFMKLQNGGLKIYVKLAATFFQHGRLAAQSITPITGGYRLEYEKEWGYWQPIEGLNQPDWWKIDRDAREKVNMQIFAWQADVRFRESGLSLSIRTKGTADIPMKLEFVLPPGGLVKTPAVTLPAQPGGWAIAGDTAVYALGGDTVRIAGGFNEHRYAPNMRNSDPPPQGLFCLYCTGYTPVDRMIDIEFI